MKIKSVLLFGISILALSGSYTNSARALNVPILTWEQGKSQSVVLGDPIGGNNNNWEVTLNSASRVEGIFQASRSNSADFKVYTMNIPRNLPVGSYTIQTFASNYPKTVVATVLIVPLKVYEIPRAPVDLFIILLFLSLLISIPSLIRRNNLKFIHSTYFLDEFKNLLEGNFYTSDSPRKLNNLEIKRFKSYRIFRESFLKQILLLDGLALYKKRFHLFETIPIFSTMFTIILFLATNQIDDLLAPIFISIIAIIVILSIFDLYSGFLAAFLYLFLNISFYSDFGLRNLSQSMIIAIIFVLPSAINILGATLFDLNKHRFTCSNIFSLLTVFSFNLGLYLVSSFESGLATIMPFVLSISIGLYLLTRLKLSAYLNFLTSAESNHSTDSQNSLPNIKIISPLSILSLFLLLLMIFYNWSESLSVAIFASIFWSLPVLISIIKFDSRLMKYFKNLPRNIYVELICINLSFIAIYYGSQKFPLLIQDRALLLMSILACPTIFHSCYVAISDSYRIEVEDLA